MAKPSNWNKLSKEEKRKIALSLLNSPRGYFIISQALYVAIETLKKVEPPHREESNIEDMEILLETLFPLYRDVKKAETEFIKSEVIKRL